MVLGLIFENVEICDGMENPERIVARMRGAGAIPPDHEFVIISMAGVAGERANREKAGRFTIVERELSAEGDYQNALPFCTTEHIRLYARRAKTRGGYLNECLKEAHNIVINAKPVHTLMVEALLQKGVLTYAECLSIWKRCLLGMPSLPVR
jgi:hypothetical protein